MIDFYKHINDDFNINLMKQISENIKQDIINNTYDNNFKLYISFKLKEIKNIIIKENIEDYKYVFKKIKLDDNIYINTNNKTNNK